MGVGCVSVFWGGFLFFPFSFFSFFSVESKQTGGEDDAKVGRAEQLSFKVAEATDGECACCRVRIVLPSEVCR